MRTILLSLIFTLATACTAQNSLWFQSSYNTASAATPTFSPTTGYSGGATTVTASTVTSACSAYIYLGTTNPPTVNTSTYSFTTTVTLYSYVHGCPGYNDSAVSTWSGTFSPAINWYSGSYAENSTATSTTTSLTGYVLNPSAFTVIFVGNNNHNTTSFSLSVTSGTAQTFTSCGNYQNYNSGISGSFQCFYIASATAGTSTIQVTATGGSAGSTYIWASQYSGLTSNTLDAAGTWTESSTLTPSCAVTTAGTGELVIGFLWLVATKTISGLPTGFNARSALSSIQYAFADNLTPPSGSNTFSATLSGTAAAVACDAVAFK